MSTGIFELTPLGAAPASNDVLVVVDVDNPAQAPQGSTVKMTVANLFTAPTFTGTTTLTGNIVLPNNGFLEGMTTAPVTVVVIGITTGNKVLIDNSALGTIFNGTATATRLIGGADVSGAIAYGTFTDGTVPATNAYTPANVLGNLVSTSSAATTGARVVAEVAHYQTAANTAGSIISAFSYIDSAHTTGTSNIHLANVASVEATGNGGTTTTLGCYRTQAVVGTGATVTLMPLIDVRSPSNTGTITTLVGVDIQAMTAGGTNFALRTHGGNVQFGSLPTSSAGLAAGTIWNNSGVLNIV